MNRFMHIVRTSELLCTIVNIRETVLKFTFFNNAIFNVCTYTAQVSGNFKLKEGDITSLLSWKI